jgi:ubiquinone/menaquinone biosynthesis C-methylase UbiE
MKKNHGHWHNHKSLQEIHEDVPPEHYDRGIKRNLFQKYWHYRRFKEVTSAVKPIEGAFLDVGCHAGTFTLNILKKINTKKVYGLDISPQAIKLAQKRIPFGKFKVGDAQDLPYKSDFFEAIFCLEMLEHVDDPQAVLSEIKRVLKKGGYGVILVPLENRLFRTVWFLWTLYYPVWRHAHVQSFTGDDLERYLKKLGLKKISSNTFNLGMLKLVIFEK